MIESICKLFDAEIQVVPLFVTKSFCNIQIIYIDQNVRLKDLAYVFQYLCFVIAYNCIFLQHQKLQ